MEMRTRLLGTAGVILAIVLGVVLIGGGSDDDGGSAITASPGGALPGEKAPTAALSQPKPQTLEQQEEKPYEPEPGSDEAEAVDAVKGVRAPLDDVKIEFEEVGEGIRGCGQVCRQQIDAIDVKPICDLMSEEAKRHSVDYYRRASGIVEEKDKPWTCEDGVRFSLRRSVGLGGPDALGGSLEIVGMNVDGDNATATIRRGKKLTTMALIKEDGEWKLPPPAGWDVEGKDEGEN